MESLTEDCLTLPVPILRALRWLVGDLDAYDLFFDWQRSVGCSMAGAAEEHVVLWIVNIEGLRGFLALRAQIRYWQPVALIFQTKLASVLKLPGLRRGMTHPGRWTRCWLAWPLFKA